MAMMTGYKVKGDNLRMRMAEMGYRPHELAAIIGRSRAQMSQYISGKCNISEEALYKMADVLKCRPRDVAYIEEDANVLKVVHEQVAIFLDGTWDLKRVNRRFYTMRCGACGKLSYHEGRQAEIMKYCPLCGSPIKVEGVVKQ